jgi:PAS domain S-box-containing protein
MSTKYEVVATSLIGELQGATVELAGESVAFTDRLGRVTYVNPAFCALHGLDREDFVGHRTTELAADDESAARYAEREAARSRGETWFGEVVDRRVDGSRLEIETALWPMRRAAGQVIGWIEVGRDVRLERAMEAQLRRAVPLETIGRLVGSVAHDLNNLLTAIRGFAELDLSAHEASGTGAEDLREILRATERAAELIRRVMTFSRETTPRLVLVDIALVARNAEPLLQQLLGEDIAVRFEQEEVPRVMADACQIEAVLLNLAANARDAMEGHGTFTVRVAPIEFDEAAARLNPQTLPGRYVLMAVSDTGTGMDEATRGRIFEPFFTTKEPGKGTGLGLANVQSIVKDAGGFITVESAPGAGTTFRIFLPATPGPAVVADAPSSICEHDGGHERILLVEDDPSVRAFATRASERHGYRVLGFGDAVAALEYGRSHRATFDALVTDLVMRGINGVTLAHRIADLVPGLRVLYMSGLEQSESPAEPHAQRIARPFGGCDLADAVGRLFGRDGRRDPLQVVA